MELIELEALSFLDRYAKAFGVLPRLVQYEPFDEFYPFLYLWKKEELFGIKYQQLKKLLYATTS